jgi:hypothetical protein
MIKDADEIKIQASFIPILYVALILFTGLIAELLCISIIMGQRNGE